MNLEGESECVYDGCDFTVFGPFGARMRALDEHYHEEHHDENGGNSA